MIPLSDFIAKNKEWVFSGAGIAILTLLGVMGRAIYQAVMGRRPPDLRVKVQPAITNVPRLGGAKDFLTITVQNHSSFEAFLQSFRIQMRGEYFLSMRDDATGWVQQKMILPPGDSFTFHISNVTLHSFLSEKGREPSDLKRAYVTDAIGRAYYSSRREFRAALRSVLR